MKFLCPACERLADIAAATVVEGALTLRCEKCGVASQAPVPVTSPAAPRPSDAAPPSRATSVPATVSPLSGGVTATSDAATARESAAARAVSAAAAPSEGATTAPEGQLVFLRALDTASPAERPNPLAVPDGYCPKCVSRKRMPGPSCASCGLVFAVFNPAEHTPPASILDAWKTLAAAWQDNDAHDRFLELASAQQALAAAGRLYRVQLAHNPDDPYAARGRDEVVRRAAAVAPLTASGETGAGRGQRAKLIGFAVVFVFFLIAVALMFRVLGGPR